MDTLLIYFLTILSIALIVILIRAFSKKALKKMTDKKLLLFTIVFSLFAALIFKIDWSFEGELKDGTVTGKFYGILVIITNLIILLIIGIKNLIKKTKAIT